ncbi:hypothetical protein SASPL_154025 [Salvia splendens]|uniref:CTLH domain-containing protein n=1 Tax=Salvia splendens TaxID=180675 RepID=A0A8X8YY27_SALSN|nr:hypothetical protein SASPL_154025 [Salvia splendens]
MDLTNVAMESESTGAKPTLPPLRFVILTVAEPWKRVEVVVELFGAKVVGEDANNVIALRVKNRFTAVNLILSEVYQKLTRKVSTISLCFRVIMGGVEDEPLPKRAKLSSGKIGWLSDGISVGEQGSCSSSGSMALQLASGDDEVVASNGVISKVEFVRVITEALYSLGYSEIGKHLEEESGIPLHSNLVATFIQQILDGQWNESVTTLHQIDLIDESIIKTACFMILERKFFELLYGEKEVDALNTLRTQIIPLNVNLDRAKELSYLMVCQPHISLDNSHSQESGLSSRKKFLGELQQLLPPTVVIPEYRLVRLVEQALDFQRDGCRLHNSVGEMSLLVDHQCGLDQVPCQTVQMWLALDFLLSFYTRLTGHGQPVSYVSWSPEDDQILTCGEDKTVRRWDIDSGECLCVYGKQNLSLLSCEWAADGKHIFTGVTDKSIRMWDLEGKEVGSWQGKTTYRMENLGITTDGKELIIHCKDDGVFLFGWETGGRKQAFVASGSENSQVYIWHRHSVEVICSLSGHTGAVNCVSWNPANPHMLASASNDRTIRIWGLKQVNS